MFEKKYIPLYFVYLLYLFTLGEKCFLPSEFGLQSRAGGYKVRKLSYGKLKIIEKLLRYWLQKNMKENAKKYLTYICGDT